MSVAPRIAAPLLLPSAEDALAALPNPALETLAGQLLIGGHEGAELPARYAEELAAGRFAGLIAFRRNLPDVPATRAWCQAVVGASPTALPPIVAIDEEGGPVSRLPKPLPVLPAARVLGAQLDSDAVERLGAAVGRQLAELGFNVNFAPVLDVDSNPANPIIGARAFAVEASRVAELGVAFARGLASAGVAPCGKHFPGHGDTSQDSHLELPTLPHSLERLRQLELVPFRAAASAGLPLLMSAHVRFPALDQRPATLSERMLGGLLRDELAYGGAIVSDCLEMKAIADTVGTAQGAVAAIGAGCDLLLVCHTWEEQLAARREIAARASRDAAFYARCVDAFRRNLALRRAFPAHPSTGALQHTAELEALIAQPWAAP